ncbi:MAG: hypothetical protein D6816_17655 [Bacteroidetes bacterium]|nr:MAG: hypothetical protein D6816_17655 [Bacteroidota bacterium]
MEEEFLYHVFVVRCWLERGGKTAVWRFTIQDNADDGRLGLQNLADLAAFIEQKLQTSSGHLPAESLTDQKAKLA